MDFKSCTFCTWVSEEFPPEESYVHKQAHQLSIIFVESFRGRIKRCVEVKYENVVQLLLETNNFLQELQRSLRNLEKLVLAEKWTAIK